MAAIALAKVASEVDTLLRLQRPLLLCRDDVIHQLTQFAPWIINRFGSTPQVSSAGSKVQTTSLLIIAALQMFHKRFVDVFMYFPMALDMWGLWESSLVTIRNDPNLQPVLDASTKLQEELQRQADEIQAMMQQRSALRFTDRFATLKLLAWQDSHFRHDADANSVLAELHAIQHDYARFHPTVVPSAFELERKFLEMAVCGTVDDDAYDRQVRDTFLRQLTVPQIAMDDVVAAFRDFDGGESSADGGRLDRQVLAIKGERWAQMLIKWYSCTTGAESCETEKPSSEEGVLLRPFEILDRMIRASQPQAAFFFLADVLFQDSVLSTGITLPEAHKCCGVLRQLSDEGPKAVNRADKQLLSVHIAQLALTFAVGRSWNIPEVVAMLRACESAGDDGNVDWVHRLVLPLMELTNGQCATRSRECSESDGADRLKPFINHVSVLHHRCVIDSEEQKGRLLEDVLSFIASIHSDVLEASATSSHICLLSSIVVYCSCLWSRLDTNGQAPEALHRLLHILQGGPLGPAVTVAYDVIKDERSAMRSRGKRLRESDS